ncbi:MAG: anti-sigma factor [Flavitalea sp.]
MNIQEYISSGIVEAYVLGLAEPQEALEFEQLCSQYPEIQEAREAFELSLEKQAIAHAVAPDRSVRSRIFAELQVEADKEPKVIPISKVEEKQVDIPSVSPFKRYMAAASVVALLGSLALNFYFYNKYKSVNNQYNVLVAAQTELAQNNSALQTKMTEYEKSLSMMNDPSVQKVKMEGTNVPTSPDASSLATVFYNKTSSEVFLVVNNLPAPQSNQQYQLWAIVDGKPVNAGVFDLSANKVLTMKTLPGAQAFAVTLEKKGGSLSPEGAMYVLGKV